MNDEKYVSVLSSISNKCLNTILLVGLNPVLNIATIIVVQFHNVTRDFFTCREDKLAATDMASQKGTPSNVVHGVLTICYAALQRSIFITVG